MEKQILLYDIQWPYLKDCNNQVCQYAVYGKSLFIKKQKHFNHSATAGSIGVKTALAAIGNGQKDITLINEFIHNANRFHYNI